MLGSQSRQGAGSWGAWAPLPFLQAPPPPSCPGWSSCSPALPSRGPRRASLPCEVIAWPHDGHLQTGSMSLCRLMFLSCFRMAGPLHCDVCRFLWLKSGTVSLIENDKSGFLTRVCICKVKFTSVLSGRGSFHPVKEKSVNEEFCVHKIMF